MLCTIGYQGKTVDEFIGQLENFRVSILIDVREIPISRKKGFSKTSLSQHLREHDIEYVHLGELGSPRALRHKLRKDNDYDYFFTEYSRHIKSHMQIIEALCKTISDHICCIMCYEKLPGYCHRSIVAEEIRKSDGNGLVIQHI